MSHRMVLFAVISFLPVPLIALAAVFGGGWVLVAFVYITVFTFTLDQLISITDGPEQPQGEFPAADRLSVTLAASHFGLLALVIWAISSNPQLGQIATLGLFIAASLFFGQVSNSNAHELIHRADRRLATLGEWVYSSMLYGHHTSAHLLVHHRFAASEWDPNSAEKGESFYSFAKRAFVGSAMAGFEMERDRLKRKHTAPSRFGHPYYKYALVSIISLLGSFAIAGWGGVLVLIAISSYTQVQLLLSDYVQHYGLRRMTLPNGKLEPVALRHSWNAPHWMSTYLMLAAPRHSDHHAHPNKPYPALALPAWDVAPRLPYSLPAMAAIALYPKLWRRVMDPRVAYWDVHAKKEAQNLAVQKAVSNDSSLKPLAAFGSFGKSPKKTPRNEASMAPTVDHSQPNPPTA